jgi:hypothetical protein
MKVDRGTPADLRAICDSLNDERGTGGQSKLARLIGWHYSTLWRKLNGKSSITRRMSWRSGRYSFLVPTEKIAP